MSSNRLFSRLCVFASLLALGFTATASYGQTMAYAVPRVLGPVNESQLTTLQKNVLPLAQPRFDEGAVADGTPTGHMMIVLKRSDAQEKALNELIAAQQDPKSASYHKWLTPQQFGAQFGVADADLQAVTSYLAAQGFQVGRVFPNKMAVEFSGTTDQVRTAFHTQIHNYSVNGQSFHANATAPQIPSALSSVVKGITLSNYKAPAQAAQKMVYDRKTGQSHPLYTDIANNNTEAVTPGDLAVIYDIPSTATGSGVTVGVIGDSNINLAIPANYRTLFGITASTPTVIVDGTDPGINVDADIAYSEIELLAATAPQANVDFYTAATTDLDTGLDFAAIRAITDNQVQVLLFGFEGCEANLGPSVNFLFGELWEQAAAQGISVIAGSGTGGAAECDASPNGTAPLSAATQGLAVNGYASTPWDTAVGTSDFFYGATGTVNVNDPSNVFYTYWSQTNGGTTGFTSAKTYIPEQPSNSSFQATNQNPASPSVVVATGGGVSTIGQTAEDGTQSPYLLPSYQAAIGIPGTARVLPDVSFFGSNNTNFSTYLLCVDASDCVNGTPDAVQYTQLGNSSLAASAFAGVAALVVQAHGIQGNLNNGLYATYAATPAAFHDITNGSNKVACTAGSPDCVGGFTATGTGPAYNAGPGYDDASGLGSVDVAKLISSWQSGTGSAAPTVTLSLTEAGQPISSFPHNAPVQLTVTVTGASGTPTGDIAISTNATGHSNSSLASATLDASGTATIPGIGGVMPGGSYALTVRYAGDSHYAAAVGSTPVTVTAVQSKLTIATFGSGSTPPPVYNGQSLPYGTDVHFSFFVQNATDNNDPYSATGYVTMTDNGKQVAILPVNSEGAASFSSSQLAAGAHSFSGTYSGDSTFAASSLTGPAPTLTITGVPTVTTVISTSPNPSASNNTMVLVATVTPNESCSPVAPCTTGAAPAGSIRFKDGNKALGTVTLDAGINTGTAPTASAALTLYQDTFDLSTTHSITAVYLPSGGNYTGSTSAPFTVTVGGGHGEVNTITALATTPANAINFVNTSTLTFDAIVNNAVVGGYGHPTGTVTFFSNGTTLGSGTPVAGSPGVWSFTISPDPSTGVLALPMGQSRILAQYNGDVDHAPSSSAYTINVYGQNSTPDFAMQSNTTFLTIAKGNAAAKFTLQFTSMNNLAALGIPITLTYTTPAGITCTNSPAAPNFGKTIYATVTTTCKPASGVTIGQVTPAASGHSGRWWVAGGGTALAFAFLFGLPERRRKWQSLVGSLALIVVAFGMTGCGASVASGPLQSYYNTVNNSTSGTPNATAATVLAPGTYTVIVTGTASVFTRSQTNTTVNVVHTVPLQIVVQ